VDGEPIRNKVTGEGVAAQIVLPAGFEYEVADIGRRRADTTGPVRSTSADSYGQFRQPAPVQPWGSAAAEVS
jgi:hypothetical protein